MTSDEEIRTINTIAIILLVAWMLYGWHTPTGDVDDAEMGFEESRY